MALKFHRVLQHTADADHAGADGIEGAEGEATDLEGKSL